MAYDVQKNDFIISDNPELLDLSFIHGYLSKESYWAENIPFELVKRSIENSLCFGLYYQQKQIGFARVVTDKATFAYLADVFIIASMRGKGLGTELIKAIHQHPSLQGLRRWMLATRDAHSLYERCGWQVVSQPDRLMEIRKQGIYLEAFE